MKEATCEDCQRQCNQSFEQRFLKGSNFVAFLRAQLGIRGRRNEPTFGFDQHGYPLTIEVQPGFPPIRIGLQSRGIERPMQVILSDERKQSFEYFFLPDVIQRPILPSLFDELIGPVSMDKKFSSFWADGDVIPANGWRELLEAFVTWSNRKSLLSSASSIAAGQAKVPFSLDWNTEYRNPGLGKICFLYMLMTIPEVERFNAGFQPLRNYILHGQFDKQFWAHGPVLQWADPQPRALGDQKFTYLLATVVREQSVFGLVRLHNMGLFCVRLSTALAGSFLRDTLTTYLLEKNESERYQLVSKQHSAAEVTMFADAVRNSGQL